MIHFWVLGDYTNTHDSTFAEALRWIRNDGVGGVTMSLGSPIEVAEKINAMQRAAKVPLMVAADLEPNLGRLEGGVFTHYLMDAGGATVFPNAMAIAATGRESDAFDVGKAIGREAKAIGILVNFAPTVDVNNNPSNPVINTRSFGEDPRRVAALASAFVKGSQEAGVVAAIKHFPGHGDTDVDSHSSLPTVTGNMARLDSVELVPFAAGIDAGAGMVMTAHIALPGLYGDSATPATLAPRIITGLLRDKLHFNGLAITDAMTMGGIAKAYTMEQSNLLAVQSGADVLLKPSDPTRSVDALVAAVERGEISRARIDSSVRRTLELKARTGVASRRIVPLDSLRDVVGAPAHRAMAMDIAQRAVTLLRDRDALLPAVRGGRTVLVQYMPETELRAGRTFVAEVLAGLGEDRTQVVQGGSFDRSGNARFHLGRSPRRGSRDRRDVRAPDRGGGEVSDSAEHRELDRLTVAARKGGGRVARQPVRDHAVPERGHLHGDVWRLGCAGAGGCAGGAGASVDWRNRACVAARVLQAGRRAAAHGGSRGKPVAVSRSDTFPSFLVFAFRPAVR